MQFAITHNWILVGLQATLLSINVWRLWSLRRLLRSLEEANAESPIRDWLLPQMKKRTLQGRHRAVPPAATRRTNCSTSRAAPIRVVEIDRALGPGSLVGEIGIFSAEHQRTASIVCDTDVVAYTMTDEAAYLLYVQNPQIGFYLIRLVIQQLTASAGALGPMPAVAPAPA